MNFQVVGGIPDDPRIHKAIEDYERGPEPEIAKAITEGQRPGIERYGVKLRKTSLMHSAMLSRIIVGNKFPKEFQPFIWLYTLGAPITQVYEAIDEFEKNGASAFMARTHEWFESCGIPTEVTQDVLNAVSETFSLAEKLVPKTSETESDDVKKNQSLGTSLPPTS